MLLAGSCQLCQLSKASRVFSNCVTLRYGLAFPYSATKQINYVPKFCFENKLTAKVESTNHLANYFFFDFSLGNVNKHPVVLVKVS